MIRDIILLGDERLYERSLPIEEEEPLQMATIAEGLHDTLMNFRRINGAGRAIAAPQIGIFKRMICLYIDKSNVFINRSQASRMRNR